MHSRESAPVETHRHGTSPLISVRMPQEFSQNEQLDDVLTAVRSDLDDNPFRQIIFFLDVRASVISPKLLAQLGPLLGELIRPRLGYVVMLVPPAFPPILGHVLETVEIPYMSMSSAVDLRHCLDALTEVIRFQASQDDCEMSMTPSITY